MVDRRRREHADPFLEWKVRIFFGGAALFAASMLLRRDVLALLAVGVLGAGLVLALVGAIRTRRLEEAARAEAEAGDDPERDDRDDQTPL